MEGRVKKYRPLSPDRAKVWTERSPKYQQCRRVPVVYYLCRNRQLEHPHFMEVPLSSPSGLYLKDVIERLNVLRGRGMASLYSWSCKRSYKNGFVWHDLSEDDLIYPAHGSEYVLKGSELFDDCNPGRFSPAGNVKLRSPKQLPEPISSRSHDDSSSSSSMNGKETKHSQDGELSPPALCAGSSEVSPQSKDGSSSPWKEALSLTEYKIYKNEGLADAATQTEDNLSRSRKARETCTRGVSTDDGSFELENSRICENQVLHVKEIAGASKASASPPPSSSSASSSGGKTETLESLIRADASKISSLRALHEDEYQGSSCTKLKASNVLMQLISCGSISVKDHSFGLIPSYRPRYSHSKFPSPLFSTSLVLGEFDCVSENPRFMGLKLEDKEYFSGSLVETNHHKDGGDVSSTLKRSSSYNADRSSKQMDSAVDREEEIVSGSKCIPRSIKASLTKQPRSESMRSPVVSDGARISSDDGVDSSRSIDPSMSNGSSSSSRRFTEPPSTQPNNSIREEKENVIKIEERLASGARVIIQSSTKPYET